MKSEGSALLRSKYTYSLDGVFGGLGVAGLGVWLVDCGGVAENSTEVRESSSSILSSEDVLGTATGTLGIVPSFLNNDDNIPYTCTRHHMIASCRDVPRFRRVVIT